MDYITLLGSEDVRKAGSQIADAADTMLRAASEFSYSLRQHQEFMEDWLARFTDQISRERTEPK